MLPTGGHIERLAQDRDIHSPKKVRKAYWSNQPSELPKPPCRTGRDCHPRHQGGGRTARLGRLYLAADQVREGELIAWHLEKLLAGLGTLHRVSFQDITVAAVLTAVSSPP